LKVLAALVLALGFVAGGAAFWRAGAPDQATAARAAAPASEVPDAEKIQGTWTLVRIEQASRKQGESTGDGKAPGKSKVIIAADTIRLWDGTRGRYALDTAKSPKQLRLTLGEESYKGTVVAIYDLRGDELKICMNLSQQDNRPPASFEVETATPEMVPALFVLERDPPPQGKKPAETDKGTVFQVRLVGPAGAKVEGHAEAAKEAKELPCRLTFDRPMTYRLKLTNIPNRPGLELYPTIEVYPATPQTAKFLAHAAVPVEFTDAEFDKVARGKVATRAVCLHQDGEQTFSVTEPPTDGDVIELAKKKGPVLLVVRLGSIDLDAPKAAPEGEAYRAALANALHHFARRGEADHVKAILTKHPELLEAKEVFRQPHKPSAGDDFTPLLTAVFEGKEEAAAVLLAKGANVQARDGINYTPLHRAAAAGDLGLVKLLVKHGAKLDARDNEGLTPLDVARERKRAAVAEYLQGLQK
jgi:uncharacterized protein (TIGR03067 family)